MGGGNNESILIISLDTFKLDFFSLQNIRVQEKQFEVLRTILTFLVDYCGFFFYDLFTCLCPKWAKRHTLML